LNIFVHDLSTNSISKYEIIYAPARAYSFKTGKALQNVAKAL
jgi:hypothetical protein